jgi:hypothetical protein
MFPGYVVFMPYIEKWSSMVLLPETTADPDKPTRRKDKGFGNLSPSFLYRITVWLFKYNDS